MNECFGIGNQIKLLIWKGFLGKYAKNGVAGQSHGIITFSDKELKGVIIPHDDPLIIELTTANFLTKRTLIDNGSALDN